MFSAFDVVEHLPHLYETFDAISLFIKKGGFLYIETPDGDYSFNGIIKNNNVNLFWIEHFSFITRKSVDFICRKYGFELLYVRNSCHVDIGIYLRFKSMIRAWILSNIFHIDRPIYFHSLDHLKILLKKI